LIMVMFLPFPDFLSPPKNAVKVAFQTVNQIILPPHALHNDLISGR
jgi:hypothetical protein